jgi:predicted transcriptional regulator
MTSLSKPVAKKRGRPLGSKNKRVRKVAGKEYTFKDKTFKQSSTDAAVHNLMDANLKLIGDNNQLLKAIENLQHQIIGFRAVISYLESQAGLKATQ